MCAGTAGLGKLIAFHLAVYQLDGSGWDALVVFAGFQSETIHADFLYEVEIVGAPGAVGSLFRLGQVGDGKAPVSGFIRSHGVGSVALRVSGVAAPKHLPQLQRNGGYLISGYGYGRSAVILPVFLHCDLGELAHILTIDDIAAGEGASFNVAGNTFGIPQGVIVYDVEIIGCGAKIRFP